MHGSLTRVSTVERARAVKGNGDDDDVIIIINFFTLKTVNPQTILVF